MAHIIAIANQKGGVGKTTTAINLSAALAEKGKKTLLVDLDPQGNATSGLGVDKERENTVYDLMVSDVSALPCICREVYKTLDLIPSVVELSGAEIEMLDLPQHQFVLKKKLEELASEYEYILIDCPPSLNLLTVNALTTAETVLVPIQCEFYAMEGLSQLMSTLQLVQERLNANLSLDGVVFTMYDGRTNLAQQVVESVKEFLGNKVYETIIPRNVRLAEAPSHGIPIMEYDGRSAGADAYRALAEEFLKRRNG